MDGQLPVPEIQRFNVGPFTSLVMIFRRVVTYGTEEQKNSIGDDNDTVNILTQNDHERRKQESPKRVTIYNC